MGTKEEETLQDYIAESLEHLSVIETDLLAIEKAGANIDKERVNKVFRAAHTIKGGAGFVGLATIKELSHKMESVLGMIRNRELIPNAENIHFLLLASDALKNLITNVHQSDEIDISEHIEALASITEAGPSQEKAGASPGETSDLVEISLPEGKSVLSVSKEALSGAEQEGKSVYLIEIDLKHDARIEDDTPQKLLDDARSYGTVLASSTKDAPGSVLNADGSNDRRPFLILFACVLEPDDLAALFEIEREYIHKVSEDLMAFPMAQSPPVEAAPDPVPGEPEIKEGQSQVATEPVVKTDELWQESVVPSSTGSESLRVNVNLLDSLMTLAGELVLTRNQLLQAIPARDYRSSKIIGKKIDIITSELQETIMLTRMQPMGNVFNKFPRVVRDMARNLGKEIELSIEGQDVELDKTLIEGISDPLTHLIRNAIDHGIESPEQRRKAGKDRTGLITMKAYHEAGQVIIEISDDGKGLDGEKFATTATARGFITEDQARTMSDRDKINLVFLPGFSLKEEVTDLSGRGVGMDVVKTNLDRLGGQVSLDSVPGKGTTIHIKVPLTLAIIPSQIIITEGERFAIPQVNLVELIRIPAGQVKNRIELVGDAEVVRLRSSLLPLVRLSDMIGVERTYRDLDGETPTSDRRENIADRRSRRTPGSEDSSSRDTLLQTNALKSESRARPDRRYRVGSALNIAVVSTGDRKYGLVVDGLYDSEEIVVQPLGRHFKKLKGYAGATIMGDGKVALILDVGQLAEITNLSFVEKSERATHLTGKAEKTGKDTMNMQSLLIFRSSENEQFAVPLNQVVRIAKIRAADIEDVGGKRVIQYRDKSLALFSIDQVAQVQPLTDRDSLLVIIFILADREVGLMAMGPVDAVEVSLEVDGTTLKQPGIMGSAIIGDQTTMLVDIFDIIHTLNPEWFSEKKEPPQPGMAAATILVVEDSNFFRNQIKGFIEDNGHRVMEAEDGLAAWDLLQKHAHEISLVVTDLEMPNLNGFELTSKIRGDERYADLPVIALTTLAEDGDIARGEKVGIDDYQIKLDREQLLESINYYLEGTEKR